jgi:glucosamine--fructose-6-phosphate aminotransferase (isomerizing)
MSRFLKENEEIPGALGALVDYYASAEGCERLSIWKAMASGSHTLLFGGMGTSEFTPLSIRWRLLKSGHRCEIFDAGEWHYYGKKEADAGTTVVLTSQSGESIELKNILSSGYIERYVAITNESASTLARGAALTLPLCAGQESSITTKTYTNNLALLRLLETVLEGDHALKSTMKDLRLAADAIYTLDTDGIERASDLLHPVSHLTFVGRGPAITSARQCALTFMEGLQCTAASFTGGAFKHGPFESVETGFRLVLFRAPGATTHLIDRLATDAACLKAKVATFGVGSGVISIPQIDSSDVEAYFPLLAARSHNQLLYSLSLRKGVNLETFRYGSKVTIEE